MAITIQRGERAGTPRVAVVTLAGELDASNYEELIDAAAESYREGARGLVLDMGGLTFMASSGLVALYSAVRIMGGDEPPDPELGWGAFHDMDREQDATANVRLADVQPAVQRVLERTGLNRLFATHDSAEDACVAIQGV